MFGLSVSPRSSQTSPHHPRSPLSQLLYVPGKTYFRLKNGTGPPGWTKPETDGAGVEEG